MRRAAIGVLILAALLLAPRVASAQNKQGDREILLFGSSTTLFSSGGAGGSSSFTFGTFYVNVGQFFTDRTEVGGGPTISLSGGAGSGTHADAGINVFGRYFFGEQSSKVKPYVGAEYQIQSLNPQGGGSITNSQYVDGVGGFKDYLSEKTALDVKASFGFHPNAASQSQILTFTVGFSFLF